MKFLPTHIYHVYNQGNNQEPIFRSATHYIHFLKKVRVLIMPNCEILAYCLMPNHFHFLLLATERSAEPLQLGNVYSNILSNGFRLLLSEYAQDFNKWNNRSGSLFRQKTKAKDMSEEEGIDSALNCFNYIHQNPAIADIVEMAKDWDFSSMKDYLQIRQGTICNKVLTYELLGIDADYVKETGLHF